MNKSLSLVGKYEQKQSLKIKKLVLKLEIISLFFVVDVRVQT